MNLQPLLIIGGVFLLVKLAVKSIGDAGQNIAANTPLGSAGIVRSVEGQKAAASILSMKWLTKGYRNKINAPEQHIAQLYDVSVMPDEQAGYLANQIVDSNFRIFESDVLDRLAAMGLSPVLGSIDKPAQALNAFNSVENQIQAVQVAYYYGERTGKDLNKGLQWLPDNYIIELNYYLISLKSGLKSKTNGNELENLPNL